MLVLFQGNVFPAVWGIGGIAAAEWPWSMGNIIATWAECIARRSLAAVCCTKFFVVTDVPDAWGRRCLGFCLWRHPRAGGLQVDAAPVSGLARGPARLGAQCGLVDGARVATLLPLLTPQQMVLPCPHHSRWLAGTEPNESINQGWPLLPKEWKRTNSPSPSDVYYTYLNVHLADYFSVLRPAAVFLLRT